MGQAHRLHPQRAAELHRVVLTPSTASQGARTPSLRLTRQSNLSMVSRSQYSRNNLRLSSRRLAADLAPTLVPIISSASACSAHALKAST
jgi:hypothetical protein